MHLPELPDDLTVAGFIAHHISVSPRTQREIAEAAGFEFPNVLSMIKTGDTKLPLNRISALARALGVDPAFLLRLTLREYIPDTWCDVEALLRSQVANLTENEQLLLERVRAETASRDPWPYLMRSDRDPNIFTLICFDARPYPTR